MSSPMSDPSTGESSEDLSAKQTLLTDMGRYEIIIFILIFLFGVLYKYGDCLYFYGIVREVHIVLEGCRCDCK